MKWETVTTHQGVASEMENPNRPAPEDFPPFIPWDADRAEWSDALRDAWQKGIAPYEWQTPTDRTGMGGAGWRRMGATPEWNRECVRCGHKWYDIGGYADCPACDTATRGEIERLATDIGNWHDRELKPDLVEPDLWDDYHCRDRLAAWLFELGYRKS